jgi:hypothetical protein
MAITTYVPLEVYLQGGYESESDVEYVDDHIEERDLGTDAHSKWQLAIQLWFSLHAEPWERARPPGTPHAHRPQALPGSRRSHP